MFKVGDRVRYKRSCQHSAPRWLAPDLVYTILETDFSGRGFILHWSEQKPGGGRGAIAPSGRHHWVVGLHQVDILPNSVDTITIEVTKSTANMTTTTLIQKFKLAITPEPERTFIQKGITNQDGSLTQDGQQLFLAYLLEQNKEEFKTEVVDKIVTEEK
jgi:hypothetical protein